MVATINCRYDSFGASVGSIELGVTRQHMVNTACEYSFSKSIDEALDENVLGVVSMTYDGL